jgi:hypothetical protein
MNKSWYQSKTLWLNVIAVLALIAQSQFGFIIDAEAQAGILAVVNMVLRAITNTGLTVITEQSGDGGFMELKVMRLILVFTLGMALIGAAGCATTATTSSNDNPMILAGKSLLTVKSTITTAATTVNTLCQSGQMSSSDCLQARSAYTQSRVAYDSAVDAYLLMSQGGDPAKFGESLQRVQNIATVFLKLTGGAK